MDKREAKQYSPLALAFMGDAVYEQKAREKIILSGNRSANELHRLAVKKVCAEYQAAAAERLIKSEVFSEEELEIFKRGRNAGGISAPKHSTVAQYRIATGLECLFGYLFLLKEEKRIGEIFNLIWDESSDKSE